MGRIDKLYAKLSGSNSNVRFDDLVALVEGVGFEERRKSGGSHITYRHPEHRNLFVNLQEVDGKAKPYQVSQVLEYINEYGLLGDDQGVEKSR